jgi:hypothetical protein
MSFLRSQSRTTTKWASGKHCQTSALPVISTCEKLSNVCIILCNVVIPGVFGRRWQQKQNQSWRPDAAGSVISRATVGISGVPPAKGADDETLSNGYDTIGGLQ